MTYFYGMLGADECYRVVCVDRERFRFQKKSLRRVKAIAELMGNMYPSVRSIFVIDDRDGLREDYMDMRRAKSMSGNIMFKDILERESLYIFTR